MVYLRSGYLGSEGHLGSYLEGHLRVIWRSYLRPILVNSGPILRPSLRNLMKPWNSPSFGRG